MSVLFDSPYILFFAFAAIPGTVYVLGRFRRIRDQLQASGQRGWPGARISRSMVLRSVFFSLSWIFLTIAVAGPRWGTRLEPVREQGAAVMFVLDISRSMTAEDLPGGRLVYAAQYAARLADELQGVPCGLVVFKGEAVLSIPLTTDRRALYNGLHTANPGMITAPGSAPASAVRTAMQAFPPSLAVSRYIILLSDGEQTQGDLSGVAAELRKQGIALIAVGVGTAQGAEINAYSGTEKTRMHQTRLDAASLEEAVRAAGEGSKYILASRAGSAVEILETIVAESDSGRKTVYAVRTVKRYPFFLLCAIVSFCAALAAGGLTWKRS